MSSNTARWPANLVCKLSFCLAFVLAAPANAQDTSEQAPAESETEAPSDEPLRIDLTVTVPRRGEVNDSNVRACEEEADAASISGDIIVCRRLGEDESFYYSGSREAARKRYAEETQDYNAPKAPDFIIDCHEQGNPPGCVTGFGSVPPPALIIDVEALPEAPPGSDADRIARGLPPLGDTRELTEEEEKARRAALGAPSSSLDGPE